ncbi:family 43 glycosylhydrolase [Roseivirga sp. UBA838]|uniref:family 43 glycosylhydrolase n=1 Tax=Roseivirga sp. UBA838 TaxID=1947393 RepID=UPI00257D4DEE|nr:family 43 glycosylhydrolase [Roseivirga sp. UBA838]|tara:strand:- start:9992 stop:11824 length:1833 start_codon:yes stop_codon:yes gene_type:complete
MKSINLFFPLLLLLACSGPEQHQPKVSFSTAQEQKHYKTYCNPLDIDYTYMSHYRANNNVSYRSGADPAIVNFKGTYYMFVTRSHGYWASEDMSNWRFIRPRSWYFNGSNAPAATVRDGKILVLGDPSGRGAVIETDNPELGDWKTNFAVINTPNGVQDPMLFTDDDGRVYLYEESSNKFPIRGVELDPDNYYIPKGEQTDLLYLQPEKHGWERFGQDHKSEIQPFIEGPWMVKHGDTYYLEYGAPGTQWNVYADGVYTSKSPLGPFEYAPYNPISYKPGGFLKGSGHGSTVRDNNGNYWHYATMAISVNYKFERRIGMYPAGFEENGQMYVNTAYGDYPHYLPGTPVEDHKNRFTGWMLLSYNKPVRTNSGLVSQEINVVDESESGYMLGQIREFDIRKINDEEIRSYWVSEANNDSIFVEVDLEKTMDVKAIQINFQDFNSKIFGRPDTLRQQFTIEASIDGNKWQTIADYSENMRDMPHGYIELPQAIEARYVRYNHVYCTNEYLSISEFRVFGNGKEDLPETPANFKVSRQKDRRNADLSWDTVEGATGYVIYWGIAEDKLNLSAMIYGANSYELRALNTDTGYYYQVEAFDENGISERSEILFTQ